LESEQNQNDVPPTESLMSYSPLLIRIDRYLRHTGTPRTRFGREVARDPRLIDDLRGGRALRADLAGKVDTFLSARGW
jgi:hypothetical protein